MELELWTTLRMKGLKKMLRFVEYVVQPDITRYNRSAKVMGPLSKQLKFIRSGVADVVVVDEQREGPTCLKSSRWKILKHCKRMCPIWRFLKKQLKHLKRNKLKLSLINFFLFCSVLSGSPHFSGSPFSF